VFVFEPVFVFERVFVFVFVFGGRVRAAGLGSRDSGARKPVAAG
jgi:hypothetical protein